jgi:uncharacterized DUF497 family protein
MEQVEIIIRQLIWDDWNIEHIARHDVTPEEVEQSLQDEHVVFLKAKLGRIIALGRSGVRLLTTILNQQLEETQFYVITARDMAKKERAYYRAQKRTNDS